MSYSSFFFKCYGDHRDLHSFPTRRSSDLAVLVDAVRALVREQERRQIESLLEQDGLDERGIGQLLQEAENRDRKSTRLNSSHANISYAVFCLKKKKKSISYIMHTEFVVFH